MKSLILLVFVGIFLQKFTVLSLGNSLPKNFRQCRQSDPAVGKCLQGALHDAFKKMKNAGIPSLGVLPLEPLVVNDIKIDPGSGGPVTLKLHFKNLKMYGIPQSNITEYRANFDDARLMTTALTSKLWFEADYSADGKVLLLPVKGSGKCNVTLSDLKTTTDLKFHPEKKNGETYWIIQTFKNKFMPKKVTVYFDGLLKGERRLNSGINQFLNDNWKVVFEELGPSFEEAFGSVFKEITHRVFSRPNHSAEEKLRENNKPCQTFVGRNISKRSQGQSLLMIALYGRRCAKLPKVVASAVHLQYWNSFTRSSSAVE